jgi:hypothetical protein
VNFRAALRARRQGARHVLEILRAARAAGIEPALALALVQRESDFRNGFGSDPVKPPQLSGGRVTRRRYRRYRELRDSGHGSQGVGLTQLTWRPFQDAADARGGCHRPANQLSVGFEGLAKNIADLGERDGIAVYNGPGPRGQRYADEVLHLRDRWRTVLAGDEPAAGLPDFKAPLRQAPGGAETRG